MSHCIYEPAKAWGLDDNPHEQSAPDDDGDQAEVDSLWASDPEAKEEYDDWEEML